MVWALLVSVILSLAGGWQLHEWKDDHDKVAAIEKANLERDAAQKRADEISDKFIARLNKLGLQSKTFYNEVRHETQTNHVYHDCVLPDSGVDILRRATDAANAAAGYPAQPVPAAPAAAAKPGNDGRPPRP